MQVALNDTESRLAKHIAKARRAYGQSSGITDKLVDKKRPPEHNELLGAMAEIAFSKLSNTYPDLKIRPDADKTDNLVEGLRVDVKATDYHNGKLLAAQYKKVGEVDVYVLAIVHVESESVRFPGYAYAVDLLKPERLTNLGQGKVYAMTQREIHHFEPEAKTLFQLP